MVHPVPPAANAHLPDAESVFGSTTTLDQVSPPSVDRATVRRTAFEPALGPPTKLPKQTYTLPKKLLLAALSAQICSLSANPAPPGPINEGAIQLLLVESCVAWTVASV